MSKLDATARLAASTPDDDAQFFSLIRDRLYTPAIGDILDTMGFFHQFLPPEIRGLTPSTRVVGRAMPVLIADVTGPQAQPFGKLTDALDQLESGEVYLAHNATAPAAAWGEILTATARIRGAAGAVIYGYHRDTPAVLAQDWPVFSLGSYAQDAAVRKSVVDYRTTIEIGSVRISPGDLIFGDRDGVVVVPRSIEREVIDLALAKAATENAVLLAIEGGMSSGDAFRTYGVL